MFSLPDSHMTQALGFRIAQRSAGLLLLTLALGGCSFETPNHRRTVQEKAKLYPDYTDLVIPPNIAPLVCEIKTPGHAFSYTFSSHDGTVSLTGAGKTVSPSLARWRSLLEASKGHYITFDLQVERKGEWVKLLTVTNHVASEPIDPALVYRLIPPSYERFNRLSICQRNLTNFDEQTLYSNMQASQEQCINCHTFKNHDGRFFAFHARLFNGGTLIFRDGKPDLKVELKCGNLYSSGAYPAWHPTDENLFAFSVNKTRQTFYMTYSGKIEVLDNQSGLILYDASKNEIAPIHLDDNLFATYPEWSPDGKTLYYTVAEMPKLPQPADETNRFTEVALQSTNMFYHLACRSFNITNRTFGIPRLLINAAESKASIAFPRVSPEGSYLMMTVLGFANFPIWHKESDLWLYNIKTQESRPLTEVNSLEADSYHAWGSNSRWFVFGSRRDDGIHTRPYLAYFNPETGKAGKPFLVPQKYPHFYKQYFYSYNRPELLRIPVPYSPEQIRDVMQQPAAKPSYQGR